MEQKYIDELVTLGYSDPQSVGTVLATRAYHNLFDDIVDVSFVVLNMPVCFDEETEKKLRKIIFTTLIDLHKAHFERKRFSPGALCAYSVEGNSLQLEFSFDQTHEKLVENFIFLLDRLSDAIEAAHADIMTEGPLSDRQKEGYTYMKNRVRAIKLFIQAGSTTYEHHIENYDIFE